MSYHFSFESALGHPVVFQNNSELHGLGNGQTEGQEPDNCYIPRKIVKSTIKDKTNT